MKMVMGGRKVIGLERANQKLRRLRDLLMLLAIKILPCNMPAYTGDLEVSHLCRNPRCTSP